MSDAIDLTGRQFGSLTVLHCVQKHMPRGYHRAMWLCQCACGTTPLIHTEGLINGSVTGCATCTYALAVRQATRRALHATVTEKVCTHWGHPNHSRRLPPTATHAGAV